MCCLLAVMATALPVVAADATKTFTFQSQRRSGQTDQVVALLEVGGETKYLDADKKPQREKMSVVCNLDYYEKPLEVSTAADATWRSVRDYQKAAVVVKVGERRFEPALRPEHRLIAVETGKQSALLFSPAGSLTRKELDAIDIQGNSLLLDRLLPDKPVAVGDRWQHSEQLLAALLGLDEVAKCTVESTLKEVATIGSNGAARPVARFEFSGDVEGAVYGIATKLSVMGKYRFDIRSKRIDWLGMLVKEEHESSFVDDGIDVTSKLQMTITPVKEPASLADAALAGLALKPTAELTQLTYECPDGGWQCRHDRRWYIYHQRPESTASVLRLLDRGMLSGQCNLSSLPSRDPAKLVSLEEFQSDVQQALGKAFGEFVEAGQSPNEANCRVYRVVVHGTASDIPMRWVYYLVADPQGRQVAFTFAVEQKLLERFADADKVMVGSLKFVESKEKEKEDRQNAEKK
jgi:hypothetical protein